MENNKESNWNLLILMLIGGTLIFAVILGVLVVIATVYEMYTGYTVYGEKILQCGCRG